MRDGTGVPPPPTTTTTSKVSNGENAYLLRREAGLKKVPEGTPSLKTTALESTSSDADLV